MFPFLRRNSHRPFSDPQTRTTFSLKTVVLAVQIHSFISVISSGRYYGSSESYATACRSVHSRWIPEGADTMGQVHLLL